MSWEKKDMNMTKWICFGDVELVIVLTIFGGKMKNKS
jgi:hypothetical protein